ncbi:hypothetical protein L226DRAFT_472059 [Lentinus tigrinus ALCF2SS1-7]|uniref:Uncharacterized protein n=1 Tax=Lentinus tigrinus ALCF2SS1-6 TaxID=1328759 RepID=A0A5C2RRR0_9APHY|nr:hypothetical protein L227DRAFT_511815 [Lentinus tigrinus ALCF2SS1-6]RPD69275.1 hypothetical protein L226DRAFT_472059 [Lentinus tigrinus ALCF2SS1-7]
MASSFPLPKAYFIALFCEAILHGMTSPINITMIVLTVVMYALSTTHIALSLRQNLIAFFDQHAADGGHTILNDPNNPLVYSQIAIEVINDAIVCWRTWVLWGRDYRVIIAPALCIIGGFASGIGMIHAFAISSSGQEVYNEDITRWFSVFGGLTCLANIYAVVAISYRACLRTLRYLSSGVVVRGGRYYSTLLVVIESGALYSIALIITIILFASDNNGVYVITDMLGHLTGIYPTAIIVLVCLNMTFHDDITHTETMLTTLQHTNDSRSRHSRSFGTVLHLRKDSALAPVVTVTSSSEAEGGLELGERSGSRSGKKAFALGPFGHERWFGSESSGMIAPTDESTKARSWV